MPPTSERRVCFKNSGVSGRPLESSDDTSRKKLKTDPEKIAEITNQIFALSFQEPRGQKPKNISHAVIDESSYSRGAALLKLKSLYKKCKKMIKEDSSARDWLPLIDQMAEKVTELEKKKKDKDY